MRGKRFVLDFPICFNIHFPSFTFQHYTLPLLKNNISFNNLHPHISEKSWIYNFWFHLSFHTFSHLSVGLCHKVMQINPTSLVEVMYI